MKLVLDTNIALDWLLFNDPATDYLREQIASKQVLIVTHAIVVDELKRVLAYSAL